MTTSGSRWSVQLCLCVAGVTAACGLHGQEPAAEGQPAEDAGPVWVDGTTLHVEGKAWADTKAPFDRLPAKAEGVVPAAVWGLSRHAAGLCIPFKSSGTRVQVRWTLTKAALAMPHMPATGVSGVDVYVRDPDAGWRFFGNGRPTARTNVASFSVPATTPCLLYLPLYNGVESLEVGVDPGQSLEPADLQRRVPDPVVFYGTSITQGGCASRPGMAATAMVGRALDVSVVNLGFSGNGRMEPALAELVGEVDACVYVLDCLWNMTPDLVRERLGPFVLRLRELQPDTPILLAEDASVRGECPTRKGRILREIHAELVAAGVTGLHLLSNEGMLGDDTDGTVDGVHPNDLGMRRQADVFIPALSALIDGTAQ